ncbi:hypothetical protein [uncultured Hoeflea sp.]|uniref:hypothetical protein n=1 Tax=uncultured Hoeflea sp. TaxID=538666 RepID=UPI0030D6D06F
MSTNLLLNDAPPGGRIASETTIQATTNPYFQKRLPIRIGLVILGCGPTMITFFEEGTGLGDHTSVSFRLDAFGQAIAWVEWPGNRMPTLQVNGHGVQFCNDNSCPYRIC